MTHLITVTEAARSFSDIVGRVYYKREAFDIKKGTTIVARLIPAQPQKSLSVSQLNDFFKNAPSLSKNESKIFQKDLKRHRSAIKKAQPKWDSF